MPVPFILSSEVGKAKATDKDPWATEHFHRNPMGSGAYKVERWDPGQQIVYTRNDKWVGGPLPAFRRVIIREIPAQATRRALVERGDVHLAFEVPAVCTAMSEGLAALRVRRAPRRRTRRRYAPLWGVDAYLCRTRMTALDTRNEASSSSISATT